MSGFYRLLKIWLKSEQISINLGIVYFNTKPFANRTSPAQWGSEYQTGLEFECGKLDWMSNGLVLEYCKETILSSGVTQDAAANVGVLCLLHDYSVHSSVVNL